MKQYPRTPQPEVLNAFLRYCDLWDLLESDEAKRDYIDSVAKEANKGALASYMFMLYWRDKLGGELVLFKDI